MSLPAVIATASSDTNGENTCDIGLSCAPGPGWRVARALPSCAAPVLPGMMDSPVTERRIPVRHRQACQDVDVQWTPTPLQMQVRG